MWFKLNGPIVKVNFLKGRKENALSVKGKEAQRGWLEKPKTNHPPRLVWTKISDIQLALGE